MMSDDLQELIELQQYGQTTMFGDENIKKTANANDWSHRNIAQSGRRINYAFSSSAVILFWERTHWLGKSSSNRISCLRSSSFRIIRLAVVCYVLNHNYFIINRGAFLRWYVLSYVARFKRVPGLASPISPRSGSTLVSSVVCSSASPGLASTELFFADQRAFLRGYLLWYLASGTNNIKPSPTSTLHRVRYRIFGLHVSLNSPFWHWTIYFTVKVRNSDGTLKRMRITCFTHTVRKPECKIFCYGAVSWTRFLNITVTTESSTMPTDLTNRYVTLQVPHDASSSPQSEVARLKTWKKTN